MNREPYKIAIVAESGRGKTYSFRNMDPKTTGYINLENKPLPFVSKFKNYSKPDNWQDTYTKLIEYAKNPEIETVVFESFSAYIESVLKTARETKKGFDVWNFYNDEIGKILYLIKKYPKDIFMTAHPAWVETPAGAVEKRIGVKGNEWNKTGIEREFTIVLFADVKLSNDNKREYYYTLNSDGTTTAKTPPVLFEDQESIPNDAYKVLEEINKMFN